MEVVVATDDERILDAVSASGFKAVLTRTDHPSGSDRVMEVVRLCGWSEEDIVLNVQGDEPFVPPAVLDQLGEALAAEPEVASATLCEPLSTFEQLLDPNLVKVVRSATGRALYFSRAPVPYGRGMFEDTVGDLPREGAWWRHIGIYGFRCWALERFVRLPMGALEALEKLEQLRFLENDLEMRVIGACEPVPGGIDTPEDLARGRALFEE
jgi:3-deoxy-manno-octulosonate cytidylyltransferase (CMP-KDO synthetase)